MWAELTNNPTHNYEPDCVGRQQTLSDYQQSELPGKMKASVPYRILPDCYMVDSVSAIRGCNCRLFCSKGHSCPPLSPPAGEDCGEQRRTNFKPVSVPALDSL